MKDFIFVILSVISLLCAVYAYFVLSGSAVFAAMFVCGFLLGIFLMNLILNVKDKKLNSYKRKLEKESVDSDKNNSRVKVLEAKIEVLEKALENALKK